MPSPAACAARSGSAMIRRTCAQRRLARGVAVGAQHHRHGAEPAERGDHRQRARARAHQHAHVLALAHPDRDQPADDVVDPLVDLAWRCRRGPRTGRTCRRAPRCMRSSTSSPSEIRVLGWICSSRASRGSCAGGLAGQLAHAARRAPRAAEHRAGDARRRPRRPARARSRPGSGSGRAARSGRRRASSGTSVTPSGSSPSPSRHSRPRRHRRPRHLVGGRAHDQAEVAGVQRQLVDVGPRRGLADRAHPGGRGDLVHGADHRQDRAARCRPG